MTTENFEIVVTSTGADQAAKSIEGIGVAAQKAADKQKAADQAVAESARLTGQARVVAAQNAAAAEAKARGEQAAQITKVRDELGRFISVEELGIRATGAVARAEAARREALRASEAAIRSVSGQT